jgi:hypothetical protein
LRSSAVPDDNRGPVLGNVARVRLGYLGRGSVRRAAGPMKKVFQVLGSQIGDEEGPRAVGLDGRARPFDRVGLVARSHGGILAGRACRRAWE